MSTALVAPADAQVTPRRCEIIGTNGPDVLTGTAGNDIICGLGGDDVIVGLGGDDEILGGEGNDQINGGAGDDLIRGDAGNDVLIGAGGNDILRGGGDADHLIGGPGDDELRGGNGDDELAGGDGADVLRGGNGNDIARGTAGSDTVFGGPGDDIIKGGSGNDRLRGGPGDDICQDTFSKTNGINCEFGKGGDDRASAINSQLWNLRGNNEFVYAMTITKPCPSLDDCGVSTFAETVRVHNGEATSSFGVPAFTAAELFDEAERAEAADRKVVFDPVLGLPSHIDNAQGGSLQVAQVELRDELRARFELARSAWTSANVTDYSYTVTTSCFCPFTVPMRVTVTSGATVSAEPIGQGAPEWTGGVKTIDEHLDDLAEVLDGRAIQVEARFDATLGLPLLVSVDMSRQIADEERSVSISDFVDAAVLDELEAPGESVVEPEAAIDDAVEEEPAEDPAPDEPEPEVDPELPADDTPRIEVPPIVSVRGIQVSEEIAEQLEALLAAAEVDGFNLSGGGFRDPQRQIDLRKKNCGTSDFAIFEMPANQCNPPTARPGQSQHEKGLAIDFTSNGRLITSQADPAFAWLAERAPAFGFINLASEPWHWSTTGN